MLVYVQLDVHQDPLIHFLQRCVPSDWPQQAPVPKVVVPPQVQNFALPLAELQD